MDVALQVETRVLPGHRIEVQRPELVEGQAATVLIVLHEEAEEPKRSRLSETLRGYTGGKLFRTAAEADAYIKAERDSWER